MQAVMQEGVKMNCGRCTWHVSIISIWHITIANDNSIISKIFIWHVSIIYISTPSVLSSICQFKNINICKQVLDWNLPSIEFYKRRGVTFINSPLHLNWDAEQHWYRNIQFLDPYYSIWFQCCVPTKQIVIYIKFVCNKKILWLLPPFYLWDNWFAFRRNQSHSWGWQAYLPGHHDTDTVMTLIMMTLTMEIILIMVKKMKN